MSPPTLFVVDDDEAVGRALASAGLVLGLPVRYFPSGIAFLAGYDGEPGCLVLDIRMPGLSGLELQRKLSDDNRPVPTVVVSGHADVRIAVEAMRLGAVTLLEKPFRLDELLQAIRQALQQDETTRADRQRQAEAAAVLASLTDKEREVLTLIAAGKTNREVATQLSLSLRAVEDRRARAMKKANANSVADVVRLLAGRG